MVSPAPIGLRKQYKEALEKYHFYENGLLLAKQDVREIGMIHPTCYTDEQRASIANYNDYKLVVKCLAKGLRELKHAILEYNRVHSRK